MQFDDNNFPSISTAMDVEAIKGLLQDVLKNDHPHIEIMGGRIYDVRCEPKKEYVLLYRFKLRNRLTNRTHKQFFTAKILKKTDTLPKEPTSEAKKRYESLEDLWIRTPYICLHHHKIVLYPFPNDFALPWLIDTVDPRIMKEYFNKLLSIQKLKVQKVKIELMGYTPLMRASFLYNVLVENKQTQSHEWRQIIGKTNTFKLPDRLFASAWAMWKASEGTIGFARPVGFMMPPRLTFQEKIPGKRLGSLVDSPSIDIIIKETARAIARFHSLSIPLQTKRKLKDEVRSIKRWSDVVIKIRPDLQVRLELFSGKVIKEIEARMRMRTPVHADFHHTNVLVDGTTVRIIDLDEMAFGDPCVDIGRFLASLRIPSLRAFGSLDKLNNMRGLFLEEYLKIRQEDLQNIRLFESASLVTAAASAFRIQRPDWRNEVSLLIDEAESIFQLSRKPKAVSVPSNESTEFEIKVDNRLFWSREPTYMQTVLTPFLKEIYNADFLTCVVSHEKKINSGCYLIQYKVSGWIDNIKWKRKISGLTLSNERGKAIFTRLSIFRKALRNTEAEHLLPRPIGYLPQIGTLIVESFGGKPFMTLLGTTDVSRVTQMFARALSALHGSRIKHGKIHSLDQEFSLIKSKIDQTKNDYPDFYSKASSLFADIETYLKYLPDKISPILYNLRPQYIYYSDNIVNVTEIAKLRFAHPYLDVGNFLAQITVMGIKEDLLEETEKVAKDFRSSYQSGIGTGENGFSAFEAGALLHLACSKLTKNHKNTLPSKLLDCAQQRLDHS